MAAKLWFLYGAMGSSKTADALMKRYNYQEKGMNAALLKPKLENRDGEKIIRSRIGLQAECEYVEDFHMQLMNCGKLTSEDCAFIISHTGRNKDIMRAVEILQERHVPIICITSNALSPIAKKADIVLVSISEETKFRPEAVTSTISQMLLIDTLFTLYSIKVDHDHEYMKSIRQIINTTRF
jgi:DNA-binding MurR/RpiR family transcriptional regulator